MELVAASVVRELASSAKFSLPQQMLHEEDFEKHLTMIAMNAKSVHEKVSITCNIYYCPCRTEAPYLHKFTECCC